MKPTPGRIVHFRPGKGESQYVVNGTDPIPALITCVWGEGKHVNVLITDANCQTHVRTSVEFVQPDQPKPECGFCHWPALA